MVLTKTDGYILRIELSHRDNVFTIEFSAINYTHPEKNQYAYRLKGLENNWNYVGNKRSVTYSNLRHGTYTFMVIASNNDGVWNDTPIELEIAITPPVWKTWWFKLTIVLVFLWLIYIIYKSRISDLRQRLQFKENQLKLER
ncbi:MAG: hypothetical protein JW894_05815 [Bacteroidales bacterium]|nr:hypothetical protein [Bacteroidales bacterium]